METRTTSALLYLDGVTVSFDGFRALNNLSLAVEPGEMRAIIGPNGAGKTTMMDVVTGKTRPDERRGRFRRVVRPDRPRRDRDRPARDRSQVPETDRVREPHRRGQPEAGAEGRPARPRQPCSGARAPRTAAIDRMLETIGLAAVRATAGRQPGSWPEAVAGDRHAAGPGAEAPPGRRAGRRHDRRRNAPDCRSCSRNQPRQRPSSWSSTT